MHDCKHKTFDDGCGVCWFKLGSGIDVENAWMIPNEWSDEERFENCLTMAMVAITARLGVKCEI